MNRSSIINIIASMMLSITWMSFPQALSADCMGCPPTATKVTIELKNHQAVTGYLEVHHPFTNTVIDLQEFTPEYFPYEAGKQGYALLYEKGIEDFPEIEADVFQQQPSSNCDGPIEFVERSRIDLSHAVILIGQPQQIPISNIVKIERRSRTYSTSFVITKEDATYWAQEPKSAIILHYESGVSAMCYGFSFNRVVSSTTLVKLLVEACTSCNTEKQELGEGFMILIDSGSN